MLMSEDGHVLRKALGFEAGGQRKKGSLKRSWMNQVEVESLKVDLNSECALCRS